MDDAAAYRAAYCHVFNQEIDMQILNPRQTHQVHGAGTLEGAVMRWYLYTLTGGGNLPMPPAGTQF